MKIICLIVIFLSLYYPTNLNYQISFYEYGYNALVLSLYFDNEYKVNNEDFIYYFEEQIKEENKYFVKDLYVYYGFEDYQINLKIKYRKIIKYYYFSFSLNFQEDSI